MNRLMLCLGVALAFGCNSAKKEEQKKEVDDKKVEEKAKQLAQQMLPELEARQRAEAQQAKAKAEDAERDELSKAPSELFETSGLKLMPTGAGHMQSVTAITLTNKSHQLVSGLRAKVDFMKDGDVEVSLPLQLKGSLPAGATRTFSTDDLSLQAASVQASGSETRVLVTTAHVDGPIATPPPAAGAGASAAEAH